MKVTRLAFLIFFILFWTVLLAPLDSHGQDSAARLQRALQMAKAGQNVLAANEFFYLLKRPEMARESLQIRYLLGLVLYDLRLYQVAAFQFVEIVKEGQSKYVKLSLEKLAAAANELGDETLLNYAISKVNMESFPPTMRDMLAFRMGESLLFSDKFEAAYQNFARVPRSSPYYERATYNKGLSAAESKNPDYAVKAFNELVAYRENAPVNDEVRVAAQIGIARALYQKKDWDGSVDAYRKVPKDTDAWHDAIFESTWAFFRQAKFRSVLSNFQTIHSTYYQDFYNPEALLLRSLVYLYICKYDEMEKVINLFEKTYGPVKNQIHSFLQSNKDPMAFYTEIERSFRYKREVKNQNNPRKEFTLPYIVLKRILDEGDVRRKFTYLARLASENRLLQTETGGIKNSPLVSYAGKVLQNRIQNTRTALGDAVKAHLEDIVDELNDFNDQGELAKLEMINGKKEKLKKKLDGKGLPKMEIDDDLNRDFYVQNGFEYWPFQGEYWLDELGNYHYVGKQSCD